MMEKNMKDHENKLSVLIKISICFIVLSSLFLFVNEIFGVGALQVMAAENGEAQEKKMCYLSDIQYDASQSSVGWGSITLDKNLDSSKNNGLITLMIDGQAKQFLKGISAHATSTLVYDITNYDYDYFTTYLGVDAGRGNAGNGVKFIIYTSVDGENWDIRTEVSPPVMKGTTNALFYKIDIRDANYIKLYAHNNGNADSDHAVYANAKLIKEGYEESNTSVDFIKTLEEYDNLIKAHEAEEITGEYEKLILERELVSRVGYDILQLYANLGKEEMDTLKWLFSDVDILRLYVMGGTPDGGNYYASLMILTKLYGEYSNDFENTELLNNPNHPEMTYGDLYKKMAMSIALTHTQRVGLWMNSGIEVNQSDVLRRYAIFKYMHKSGGMVITSSMDMTHMFEDLHIEEMRLVLYNNIDDEEILWLNRYVQDNVDNNPNNVWRYTTPHPYIAYVWPNYANEVYYAPENVNYFNELFAINKTDNNVGTELLDENGEGTGKVGMFDSEFVIPGGKTIPEYRLKITRGTPDNKIYKVWMNFRNKFGTGCVCGGISKSGANIRGTHGIPATVIGQPGHAALLFYSKDAEGRGFWRIDNDVSGWTLSGGGGRLLRWGSGSYASGYSNGVYVELEQAAINEHDKLIKAEEQVMLAKVYSKDLEDENKKQAALVKQEELYRKALEIQSINFDAWLGLIEVYNANEAKKENDFYNLAEEIAENLKYYPLPMLNATDLIKPRLTSIENSYRFALLQTRILKEASVLPNNTETSFTVMQPGVARVEANFLLGKIDTSIATFAFDGADSGKIVLASRFDGNGVRWDYSLDGKQTWKEVSFSAEEEHKWQLTAKEIESITAENDIYVHIVGVGYEEKNLYKIDITEQALPSTLFANDLENRVVGVTLGTEWRYHEDDGWTSYSVSSPDLTGNKTVQVRQSATGTQLTSPVSPMYTFTEDNQPDTRKYIPVSHLTIQSVSTEATSHAGQATNAIDANYNTRWHSAWNGTDTQRYIVIKLDRSVSLSAVEFVPAGGGNGKILDGTIYGSMDGENWEELTSMTNLTYTNQANANADAITNTKSFEITEPKEVQYVKIVANRASNGNWFTARAFNLYQDLTKNPHPTAGIAYSTTEPTNGIVVARLVNPSREITITNNDGKDTYIFTKNGEFTFEFVDKNGVEGSAIAKVNWIDKDGPTADVEYELDDEKKVVISLDNISEDVYLLDKNDKKINFIEVKNKKVSNISYLDSAGNITKVVTVDENGTIKKISYKNTTGEVSKVGVYTTTIENGTVASEEYLDSEGNPVTVTDAEKETLRGLQQTMTNPLEYTFDTSGDYEFKMLDKASNIAYKSIKVDYIENNTTILASDITYDITKATNQNVVATINPYIIDTNGQSVEVEIVNNDGNKKHTFTKNGAFTFEYKSSADTDNMEVKEHKAEVTWIDKIPPTAEIKYSTKEQTDKVVVTLVNESEEITIMNNGTSREYTFTKNGEFTFEFEDKAGNKGTATAKVDWIKSGLRGDIDGDGELTIRDLAKLKLHYVGLELLEGRELEVADIDMDGEITIRDIAQLKLALIGLIELK